MGGRRESKSESEKRKRGSARARLYEGKRSNDKKIEKKTIDREQLHHASKA